MKGAAAALVLAAGTAHGAPAATVAAPDPAAVEAGDANLESVEHRRGTTLSVGLGGALTFGMGVKNAVGRGGGFDIRVGRVATRHTVITLELSVCALPHQLSSGGISTNSSTSLLVGAQHWVNESLWVRAGLGYGVFLANDEPLPGASRTLRGAASVVGAGVDLVRWKSAVLDLELLSVAMVNREGVLSSSALLLGLAFD